MASQNGHIEVIKELITSGAQIDLQNNTGESPLYIASLNGHISSFYIPGSSPCKQEELVSTEWMRDLDYKELLGHHKLRTNILHIASENGRME